MTLTQPLVLEEAPIAIGALPKGTVLYPYPHGPSISTYVVFVNTKKLSPLRGRNNLSAAAQLQARPSVGR